MESFLTFSDQRPTERKVRYSVISGAALEVDQLQRRYTATNLR